MTAWTMPVRPLPWRRMGWVTWRQHRLTLAGAGALFAAAAGYVLVTGLRMHHAYAAVRACQPAASDACQRVANDFANSYASNVGATAALALAVPALAGAFTGAPVLAREFETGTFRYAWTQGMGRTRWTVAKVVPLGVLVTAAALAFSVLFGWAYQPIIDKQYGYSPLQPLVFALRGVAFAGWTLAAFAIGVLAGALVRRAVPAIFATLAAWAGLAFGTGQYLRGHYEAPLVTTDPGIGTPQWVMSQQWLRDGRPASLSMIDGALHPVGVRALTFGTFEPGPGTPDNFDPIRVPVPAGLHPADHVPAGQPVLAVPVDRGRLAARAVGAPPGDRDLGGAPPRELSPVSRPLAFRRGRRRPCAWRRAPGW